LTSRLVIIHIHITTSQYHDIDIFTHVIRSLASSNVRNIVNVAVVAVATDKPAAAAAAAAAEADSGGDAAVVPQ